MARRKQESPVGFYMIAAVLIFLGFVVEGLKAVGLIVVQ